MGQEKSDPQVEPGQEVEVGLCRLDVAQGVAECFRAVYGQDYPIKTYYHPSEFTAALERDEIISVVARTSQGQVVGVVNLFTCAPFAGIYEVGAGLVLPTYRQRHLNNDMIKYLLEVVIPQRGVPMGYGEAVLNHLYQQRTQHALGYMPTALAVDQMPAAAYSKEASATGRVAVLMAFRSYQPHTRLVRLPPRYDAALRQIYGGIDLDREFMSSDPKAELRGATEFKTQVFDFAHTARVAVHQIGADLASRIDALLTEMRARGVVVVQIWLRLDSPQIGAAVEVLRARGFFLGGVMPRWFDEDGLFLQWVHGQPNWREIQILPGKNQVVFDLVQQDWQQVRGSAA